MSISYNRAMELFAYDPDTGMLCWRVNKGTTGRAGAEAGYSAKAGYRRVKIDGSMYLAHRIIWLFVYGSFPDLHIDHIDGNTLNNRLSNLRAATNTMNMENQTKPLKNNKSGYLGVSYRNDRNKYRAQIWVGPKRIHIGDFGDAKSAHEAYLNVKRELHAGCI